MMERAGTASLSARTILLTGMGVGRMRVGRMARGVNLMTGDSC